MREKKITDVCFDEIPDTYDKIAEKANVMLYEPETAAALFICALKLYTEDREEGAKSLNMICHIKETGDPMYFPRLSQIAAKEKYLPNSYFSGATPENGYDIPTNVKISVKSDNAKGLRSNMKTVYIGCSGSGSYRPITLTRYPDDKADEFCDKLKPENDMWFVSDFISIILNIKRPE